MQKLFYGLVNGSTGDPALYLELAGRAALVDCGHLIPLRTARIHRVREVFISHAHVDHFFGFDWLVRVFLGADRELDVYGPPGMADRVAAKIDGYTWNIEMDFALVVRVHEIHERELATSEVRVRHGVERAMRARRAPREGDLVLDLATHRVRAAPVDHGTPCLAYVYEQKRGVRILEAELARRGLPRGPWLRELRSLVLAGAPGDAEITVDGEARRLGDLAPGLTEVAPGTKVAYVSDTLFTDEVRARVTALAAGADTFFCEGKYLARDGDRAGSSRHLTAREAAILAREAGARELVLFHPSPKYQDDYGRLLDEARSEFPAVRFQERDASAGLGTAPA
jgi:ribonuclease Z